MKPKIRTRLEKDSLGSLQIPLHALYGIQTFRATQNFPISGTQVHPELVYSFLIVKKAAAIANWKIKALDARRKKAIVSAIDSLLLDRNSLASFVVDAYQAGAGTSQNMNANEVIANKANLCFKKSLGSYKPVHPNDHVNMSQSTNDIYPTAMRLAALNLSRNVLRELSALENAFNKKATEFDSVIKAARTHLQDAVPIRLGQEFAAYAQTIKNLIELGERAQKALKTLGIGGSAAGTGINVPKGYRKHIILELRKLFHEPTLRLSKNLCSEMQSQLPIMIYSNFMRAAAIELTRIINDLRLLSSGPSNGFAEINLPSTQPGSSIMPGKVNPSILEMGNQVLFKVLGNDTSLALAMQAGQLELNVMMPLMAHVTLESSEIFSNMLKVLRLKCIDGITANVNRCQKYAEQTTAISTALNPILGYTRVAELTKVALHSGKTILQLVRDKNILTEKQIRELLDPARLT